MNHQMAARTIPTNRIIAHIGKPLELGAAAWARLAAALVVALAALAALETVELAVLATAAPRLPIPARSPVALSAFAISGGRAAEIAPFWLVSNAAKAEGSDQLDGSCWPIVPITACPTAPTTDCAAPCGAPAYWLRAPTRLDTAEPPSSPPRRLAPSVIAPILAPPMAPVSLVSRSGSEFDTASTSRWPPPGAAAVVAREARIVGIAAAASRCAIASLMPTGRARLPTSWGVRN